MLFAEQLHPNREEAGFGEKRAIYDVGDVDRGSFESDAQLVVFGLFVDDDSDRSHFAVERFVCVL